MKFSGTNKEFGEWIEGLKHKTVHFCEVIGVACLSLSYTFDVYMQEPDPDNNYTFTKHNIEIVPKYINDAPINTEVWGDEGFKYKKISKMKWLQIA